MKKAWQISLIILLLLFSIGVGTTLGMHIFFKQNQNIIFSGVTIEGYNFSGLNRAEAKERLKKITKPILNKDIILEGEEDSWLLDPGSIKLKFKIEEAVNKAFAIGRKGNLVQRSIEVWQTDKYGEEIDLRMSYSDKILEEELVAIGKEINSSMKNAYMDLETKQVIKAKHGRKLNIEKSKMKIVKRLSNLEDLPIRLVIEEIKPEVNEEDLKELGLTNQISTYLTEFNTTKKGRVENIKLASQKINGTLLKPGESFSFNDRVGPRTLATGFKEAIEIVNQEFVTGIGGGVCQVSSTLYNAVLLGDFKVLVRQNHSRPVSYVPLGRGATVYYDYLDFEFKNNTSAPIMILSKVKGNRLRMSIMGQERDYQVEIFTSEPEVIEYEEVKKVDPSLQSDEQKLVRRGKNGYRVIVKKRIISNNQVLKEVIVSEDRYQPVDQIIKVTGK